MAKLFGRFAPILAIGQVVDGQSPLGAGALDARVVVHGPVQRGPCGQLNAAVFGGLALCLVAQAQAGAQAGYGRKAVLGLGAKRHAGHVQGALAVDAGVDHGVLAQGLYPGGTHVQGPLGMRHAGRQVQSPVTGLAVDFSGAGVVFVASAFVARYGTRDVKPTRLPARLGPLAFDTDFCLMAAQRWQGLSSVGVTAAVGRDIGLNAFAVTAIHRISRRDLVRHSQPWGVEAALVLHGSAAVGALAGAVELCVAHAQPQRGLCVEFNAVAQSHFGGVFAALGVQLAWGGLGLGAD